MYHPPPNADTIRKLLNLVFLFIPIRGVYREEGGTELVNPGASPPPVCTPDSNTAFLRGSSPRELRAPAMLNYKKYILGLG